MKNHRLSEITGVKPRWHVRRALATPVTVEIEGGMWARLRGNSRNLGLGGMCAQLDTNALYPNAPVLVRFTGRRSTPVPTRPLHATVAWTSGSIVGLAFHDSDVATLQAIWNLLLRSRLRRRKRAPRRKVRN